MSTLEAIRAKLRAAEAKKSQPQKKSGDGLTFPYWDAEAGSTSVIRFLPDGNPDNTFFWVERQLIKLEFPGIKGYDEHKSVTIQVPCMHMWNATCPVMDEVKHWFNGDKEQEEIARKYWKKRTYIFQGFVRDSGVSSEKDTTPENPIRKFVFGPQVFGLVKAALVDSEMENVPTDYQNGTDFRLAMDKKGGKENYSDYTKSTWSRRESSLTEEELEAITTYGLVDLATYLPEKPTPEALQVIVEMFEASVNGELYDPDRWGSFYKPYGLEINSDAAPAQAQPKVASSVKPVSTPSSDDGFEEEDDLPRSTSVKPVSTPSPSTSSASAQEILAKIRAGKQ